MHPEQSRRLATLETIRPDITAYELAVLMRLSVRYSQAAFDAITPEEREIVTRNSEIIKEP